MGELESIEHARTMGVGGVDVPLEGVLGLVSALAVVAGRRPRCQTLLLGLVGLREPLVRRAHDGGSGGSRTRRAGPGHHAGMPVSPGSRTPWNRYVTTRMPQCEVFCLAVLESNALEGTTLQLTRCFSFSNTPTYSFYF